MKRFYLILIVTLCFIPSYGQREFVGDTVSADTNFQKLPGTHQDVHYNLPSIILKTVDIGNEYKLNEIRLRNYNEYNFMNPAERTHVLPVNYNRNLYNNYFINDNQWINTYRVNSHYISLGGNYMIGGTYNLKINDIIILSAGMYAAKYSFANSLLTNGVYTNYTDAGFTGNVKFIINDYIRANIFGQYSLNGNKNGIHTLMSPMYPQTNYGGSFEFKISDKWGIEAGVEREFDIFQRKWITRPFIGPVFYGK